MQELQLGVSGDGKITLSRVNDSLVIYRGNVAVSQSLFLLLMLGGCTLLILGIGAAVYGLVLGVLTNFQIIPALFVVMLLIGGAIVLSFALWIQGLVFSRSLTVDFSTGTFRIRNGLFFYRKSLESMLVIEFAVVQSRGDWGYRALLNQTIFGVRVAAIPICSVGSRAKTNLEVKQVIQWLHDHFDDKQDLVVISSQVGV